jgi:hypothetical protein
MSQRRWMLVVLSALGAGCTPYIMKDNVVGPHGEKLVELACATPDQCMTFAREVCAGDFDIATNDFTVTGGKTPTSGDYMMVHCQNAPPPPGAPHPVAPDAGS